MLNVHRPRPIFPLLACLLVAVAVPALAQSSAAGIRGVLLDAEGMPAVGYQVVLHGATGDLFLTPPTAEDGSFKLAGLPPGRYAVSAFDPNGEEFGLTRGEVTLEAGRFARLELRLAGEPHPPGRPPPASGPAPRTAGLLGRPWLSAALPAIGSAALALLLSNEGERPASPSNAP